MWRTRVGYAGGDYANPTYHDLGDQTECFQVDFDPAAISYAELVEEAFLAHNPTWVAHNVQYASLVLAHDDAQLQVALEVAARFSAELGGKRLATRIEPLKRFWLAEDYHQKYEWKQFVQQWERDTAGQAPDWRSPEFVDWLVNRGFSRPQADRS